MSNSIETKNLILLACDKTMLESAIAGNKELEKYLRLSVPENWTEFGEPVLSYALERINSSKDEQGWWTYFPVHKLDKKIVGSCGYKGKPDPDGAVEIGYEIAAGYRNQGLATELAQGLIQNAFKDERTKTVQAHTLAENNASTKVLLKCGFEITGELEDPDDGKLWKWELIKN